MNEDDRSRSGSLHWPIHPLSTLACSTRQDRFILFRNPVPIEHRLGSGTTGFAQTAAQCFILRELHHSVPEGMPVPSFHQSSRLPQHLRKSRITHRGHCPTVAHGLCYNKAKGLKSGVEYEHVAGKKIRSELPPRDVADEANLLVDSQLAGHSSKPRFLRAFSAHRQYSRSFPVKVVSHRAKHDVQAFLRSETLDGKEQRRTR